MERVYEAAIALRQHRDRCELYHAALQVHLDGDRFVIEMAPVWDRPEPDRGVVAEGAVGLPWLGRSRLLLARSGHDTDAAQPPPHGRAPGWSAGLTVAARQAANPPTPAR